MTFIKITMVVLCEQHQVRDASGSIGGSNYSGVALIVFTRMAAQTTVMVVVVVVVMLSLIA